MTRNAGPSPTGIEMLTTGSIKQIFESDLYVAPNTTLQCLQIMKLLDDWFIEGSDGLSSTYFKVSSALVEDIDRNAIRIGQLFVLENLSRTDIAPSIVAWTALHYRTNKIGSPVKIHTEQFQKAANKKKFSIGESTPESLPTKWDKHTNNSKDVIKQSTKTPPYRSSPPVDVEDPLTPPVVTPSKSSIASRVSLRSSVTGRGRSPQRKEKRPSTSSLTRVKPRQSSVPLRRATSAVGVAVRRTSSLGKQKKDKEMVAVPQSVSSLRKKTATLAPPDPQQSVPYDRIEQEMDLLLRHSNTTTNNNNNNNNGDIVSSPNPVSSLGVILGDAGQTRPTHKKHIVTTPNAKSQFDTTFSPDNKPQPGGRLISKGNLLSAIIDEDNQCPADGPPTPSGKLLLARRARQAKNPPKGIEPKPLPDNDRELPSTPTQSERLQARKKVLAAQREKSDSDTTPLLTTRIDKHEPPNNKAGRNRKSTEKEPIPTQSERLLSRKRQLLASQKKPVVAEPVEDPTKADSDGQADQLNPRDKLLLARKQHTTDQQKKQVQKLAQQNLLLQLQQQQQAQKSKLQKTAQQSELSDEVSKRERLADDAFTAELQTKRLQAQQLQQQREEKSAQDKLATAEKQLHHVEWQLSKQREEQAASEQQLQRTLQQEKAAHHQRLAREKAEHEKHLAEEKALAEQETRRLEEHHRQLQQEKIEHEKRIAEERVLAERLAQEKAAHEKRLAREKILAEKESRRLEEHQRQLQQEKADHEKRLAEEKALAERIIQEKAEHAKRLLEEKALAERLAEETAAHEKRLAHEKALAEEETRRLEKHHRQLKEERAEHEKRLAEEKILAERLEHEKRAHEQRLAEEKALTEKLAQEKVAHERRLAEEKALAEQETRRLEEHHRQLQQEKAEHEKRIAEEKALAERLAQEKVEHEKRLAEERALAERLTRETAAHEKRLAEEKALAEQETRRLEEHQRKLQQEKVEYEKRLAEEKSIAEQEARRLEEHQRQLEAEKAAHEMELLKKKATDADFRQKQHQLECEKERVEKATMLLEQHQQQVLSEEAAMVQRQRELQLERETECNRKEELLQLENNLLKKEAALEARRVELETLQNVPKVDLYDNRRQLLEDQLEEQIRQRVLQEQQSKQQQLAARHQELDEKEQNLQLLLQEVEKNQNHEKSTTASLPGSDSNDMTSEKSNRESSSPEGVPPAYEPVIVSGPPTPRRQSNYSTDVGNNRYLEEQELLRKKLHQAQERLPSSPIVRPTPPVCSSGDIKTSTPKLNVVPKQSKQSGYSSLDFEDCTPLEPTSHNKRAKYPPQPHRPEQGKSIPAPAHKLNSSPPPSSSNRVLANQSFAQTPAEEQNLPWGESTLRYTSDQGALLQQRLAEIEEQLKATKQIESYSKKFKELVNKARQRNGLLIIDSFFNFYQRLSDSVGSFVGKDAASLQAMRRLVRECELWFCEYSRSLLNQPERVYKFLRSLQKTGAVHDPSHIFVLLKRLEKWLQVKSDSKEDAALISSCTGYIKGHYRADLVSHP